LVVAVAATGLSQLSVAGFGIETQITPDTFFGP
jgi:hypothetical protein